MYSYLNLWQSKKMWKVEQYTHRMFLFQFIIIIEEDQLFIFQSKWWYLNVELQKVAVLVT